jgi:hypothetical protein
MLTLIQERHVAAEDIFGKQEFFGGFSMPGIFWTGKSCFGRWCSRTAGRATRPEWIESQGFYFEPRAGGEVRILGLKTTNKQTNKPVLPVKVLFWAGILITKYS